MANIVIACECEPGVDPPNPYYVIDGKMCHVSGADHEFARDSTHQLHSNTQYDGNDNGCDQWPLIAVYLLELMLVSGIKRIWYGGDDETALAEMNLGKLYRISYLYVENSKR